MSIEQIDRLLVYRKAGKFVNSAQEFQQVTRVSDDLLAKLVPILSFLTGYQIKAKLKNKSFINIQQKKRKIVKRISILPHVKI